MKNKLKNKKLVVKSRTENLSAIRDFIASAAHALGIDEETVEDIMLAADEACSNIIKHAYKLNPEGEIKINIDYSEDKFTVIIQDNGTSFEPNLVPEPDLQKYYRQRKVGGLGMFLMKSLMDDVKYITVPGKYNRVLLTKNVSVAQSNAG
ncbi:MAG: ATP-binding protein [Ignavibacteriaceae bacterium]|nr:ATP-binding protein [Ignavibacteriaceae bacterium]